jgi:hypothetical protein
LEIKKQSQNGEICANYQYFCNNPNSENRNNSNEIFSILRANRTMTNLPNLDFLYFNLEHTEENYKNNETI